MFDVSRDDHPMLAEKLSDVLDDALDDLEACVDDPEYEVNMDSWHRGGRYSQPGAARTNLCIVCLAGATMAKSIKVSKSHQYLPTDFTEYNQIRLYALDSLRVGQIKFAVVLMKGDEIASDLYLKNVAVVDYSKNSVQFMEQMRAIAKGLRKRGL